MQALQKRMASAREVRAALATAEGDNALMEPVARRQLDAQAAKVLPSSVFFGAHVAAH